MTRVITTHIDRILPFVFLNDCGNGERRSLELGSIRRGNRRLATTGVSSQPPDLIYEAGKNNTVFSFFCPCSIAHHDSLNNIHFTINPSMQQAVHQQISEMTVTL